MNETPSPAATTHEHATQNNQAHGGNEEVIRA